MGSANPDFICVGGEKCGTTALYYYLKQHPEIWVPGKDTYFFNPQAISRLGMADKICTKEQYRSFFSGPKADAAKASGEIASFYLYCYQEVIGRIQEGVGDPKILILLRQPVDRAWSNYQHYVRDLKEPRSFGDAVEQELADPASIPANRHYVNMGFYSSAVSAFLRGFSEVKIVLFDDLVSDAPGVMGGLFDWLGVDESFQPDFSARYNSSGVPKNSTLHWLLFAPHDWKLKVKDMMLKTGIPEEPLVRLIDSLRRKNLQKKQMSPDIRARLLELYRPDICTLQELIGRDLSGWLK